MGKFKGTPGPWRWEVNLKSKDINLVGGVPRYDLTVMDFVRYGTGGASPRFRIDHEPGFNIMERAETMVKIVHGREHHAGWFQTLLHPDANLIAAAPDLLVALQEAKQLICSLKLSMLAHPDCTEGSEFDDYTSTAQEFEDKAAEVINIALAEG